MELGPQGRAAGGRTSHRLVPPSQKLGQAQAGSRTHPGMSQDRACAACTTQGGPRQCGLTPLLARPADRGSEAAEEHWDGEGQLWHGLAWVSHGADMGLTITLVGGGEDSWAGVLRSTPLSQSVCLLSWPYSSLSLSHTCFENHFTCLKSREQEFMPRCLPQLSHDKAGSQECHPHLPRGCQGLQDHCLSGLHWQGLEPQLGIAIGHCDVGRGLKPCTCQVPVAEPRGASQDAPPPYTGFPVSQWHIPPTPPAAPAHSPWSPLPPLKHSCPWA